MSVVWEKYFSERARMMKTSEIRKFFKLTERQDIISFAGGFPGADFFPTDSISIYLQKILKEQATISLQYGPTEGQKDLRSYLANKMTREGIASATENNILITSGSQQGLDLLSRVLLDPGDIAIVEEPGYIGGLGAINNYQGSYLPIPLDDKGMRTDILEKKLAVLDRQGKRVKFAYLVPNFQNPTGVTLSLLRREKILQLAERYDFLIVEDNPYGELRYEGYPFSAIKSMDRGGRVIYLGSFSKTFIPGIRTGWLMAEECFVEKLITAKQATDLCSNSLSQQLVYTCCINGFIDNHVQSLVDKYRAKRDMMLSCMEKYFPAEISWTYPRGGFFVWVTLPKTISAENILLKALDRKVAFVNGVGFYTNGKGKNTARFSFSEASLGEISTGIERLGSIFHEEILAVKTERLAIRG